MRYVWLTIIAVSIVPLAFASVLLNPLTLWILGPEAWRQRLGQLAPYRWWFVLALVALGVATLVYSVKFA